MDNVLTIDPEMVAATRRMRLARAPVPLEPLLERLQKFTGAAGSIFALMRRIMLVILQRVAALFKVKLDHQGLDADGAAPTAAFEGDPDFQGPVQEAASAAALQLNAFVQGALAMTQEGLARQMRELEIGAAAYLATSLDQLGAAATRASGEVARLEPQVEELLQGCASRLGVEAESLRALLTDGPLEETSPLAADADVRRLATSILELETARQQLVQIKMSFCDHCVAARHIDEEGNLGSIAKRKAAAFGDSSLVDAVELALAHRHNRKEGSLKNHYPETESPLNSARTVPTEIARAPSNGDGYRNRAYFSNEVSEAQFEETFEEQDCETDGGPQRIRQRLS